MSCHELFVAAALAIAAPGGDDWKYDVVHMRDGRTFKGLLVEDAAQDVVFKCVVRRPGRPTIVFRERLPRAEIARVALADPADRKALQQRLDALASQRRQREILERALDRPPAAPGGAGEDAPALRRSAWVGDPEQPALAYESTYFRLVSNARADLVELAADHLEQVYAAYTRALPPRASSAVPTTIVLTRSVADYFGLARGQGLNLRNPAYYDAARNRIVCASELQRLADELDRARQRHAKEREELKKARAELAAAFDGKVPADVLRPVLAAERAMDAQERANEETFKRAQHLLFRRLYHEAFHAYLANFVYPPRAADKEGLPRWLNEGLAQIFETAVVEAGELRVGHTDRARYDALRALLREKALPPLADVLRAGPEQFLVAHAADRPTSDRAYLASWALAFYLSFERRLLGTPALDAYAASAQRGGDPLAAFAELVGRPLPEFEKEWHDYLDSARFPRPDPAAR